MVSKMYTKNSKTKKTKDIINIKTHSTLFGLVTNQSICANVYADDCQLYLHVFHHLVAKIQLGFQAENITNAGHTISLNGLLCFCSLLHWRFIWKYQNYGNAYGIVYLGFLSARFQVHKLVTWNGLTKSLNGVPRHVACLAFTPWSRAHPKPSQLCKQERKKTL